MLNLLGYAVQICAVSILGPLVDDPKWGRKKVLLIAYTGATISLVLLWINNYAGKRLLLVYISQIFSSTSNNFQPASLAVAADLAPPGESARSIYMSVYSMSQTTGQFIGLLFGYYILTLDLYDYSYVWLGFSIYLIVASSISAATLRETLTVDPNKQKAATACCGDFCEARRIVAKDWFLLWFVPVFYLGVMGVCGMVYTLTNFQITCLDYTESAASVGLIVLTICMITVSMDLPLPRSAPTRR